MESMGSLPQLRIMALGPPRVLLGDAPVTLPGGHKTLALLVYLALAGRAHGRDALTALLTDAASDARARGHFRTILHSLRAERPQPYNLDATHPKANKGEVVLMLSKLLAIPPEQIATIGDIPNDALMFTRSGVSIAMGNASPEVQQAATYVTTSNEEEGFANAMERVALRATATTGHRASR
jgi:hypothetical protein